MNKIRKMICKPPDWNGVIKLVGWDSYYLKKVLHQQRYKAEKNKGFLRSWE